MESFMKIIYWLVAIVGIAVGALYTLAFTSFGNNILKPIVEEQIRAQTHLPSALEKFEISSDAINILLHLNKNNTVALEGKYSLFSQSVNIAYNVNLGELATLKPLTSMELQDSLHTKGTLIGDMNNLEVKGSSNVAKSNTEYKIALKEFNPTKIIAKVKKLDLAALLHMLKQKEYASADVDVAVNFNSIKEHNLDGDIALITKDGHLNSRVMQKDFNLTIPKTDFSMKLNAKLKGDDVNYKYTLFSNLAKITSRGLVKPQPLSLDLVYGVNVKELAVLKPLTKADIRGPLKLNGTLKGTKERMTIDGKSDIADSKTTFSALLNDFTPTSAKVDIVGLKLQKLLYMVKQPHYTDGLLQLHADITNANPKKLAGVVQTKITEGKLDSAYLTKTYKFKHRMPATHYGLETKTVIKNNIADTKATMASNLANLYVKSAKFNLKDTSLKSDYRIAVASLDKLYFVIERHLKGGFEATGDVIKAKDFDATMHTNIAQGVVNAKLHNDDFHADIKGLQTFDILDMLLYPTILKSTINAKLDYNLVAQKGDFIGKISDGFFTRNSVLDLTKQYAKIDLYKQRFGGDLGAKINKEILLASLDLRSNTSFIKTKKTLINSKKGYIDSTIEISANKHPLKVKLKGDIKKPKIVIDANEIIKKEATKAITKEINKRLGKDVGNLLKGLF
jgi:hypothetical protein